MTTRSDTMLRPFTVTWEGVLPGTPEQVWNALTRQSAAWIWEIDFDPRVGGAERGLTSGGGTVTVWEPPRRFATRAERADGWHNQLDYDFERHPDGTLLRYRHRSVTDDVGWIELVEQCTEHTDFYLHSLGEYVRWFDGREARYVGVDGDATAAALFAALELPGDAHPGDVVTLRGPGGAPLHGTLDWLTPRFLGLRADDLLFRVYGRDRWDDPTTIALHLFDPAADVGAAERELREWLTTHATTT